MYARALGREDEMLDEHGGSTVLMISPARLRFSAGQEHIVCGRMTSKGPLRWHTACCKTPLANTIPRDGVPFMAVHPLCIVEQPITDHGGPVRGVVNTTRTGEKIGRLYTGLVISRMVWLLLMWRLQGAHKKFPFPDVAPHRLERIEG